MKVTYEQLLEIFKAGFESSGQGFNGEHCTYSEEELEIHLEECFADEFPELYEEK